VSSHTTKPAKHKEKDSAKDSPKESAAAKDKEESSSGADSNSSSLVAENENGDDFAAPSVQLEIPPRTFFRVLLFAAIVLVV
jgi:hypothetical protein